MFDEDLLLGKEAEDFVKDMLVNTMWPDTKLNESEDYETQKAYDLINSEFTVEVKYDRKAEDTGNIFIETRCNEVASGIAGTKADYWVHVIKEGAWGAKVERLRELIDRDLSIHGSMKDMVGDGLRVEGIVFSKEWMQRNMIRIAEEDSYKHAHVVSLFYQGS